MLEIADKLDLIEYCGAIFTSNDVPMNERVVDAERICELTLSNPNLYLTSVELFCSVICRSYSSAKKSDELCATLALLAHIGDKDVLAEVATKCANHAYGVLCKEVCLQLRFTYFFSLIVCRRHNFLVRS